MEKLGNFMRLLNRCTPSRWEERMLQRGQLSPCSLKQTTWQLLRRTWPANPKIHLETRRAFSDIFSSFHVFVFLWASEPASRPLVDCDPHVALPAPPYSNAGCTTAALKYSLEVLCFVPPPGLCLGLSRLRPGPHSAPQLPHHVSQSSAPSSDPAYSLL